MTEIPAALQPYKRLAWKPIISEGDGDLTASKFSGRPWLSQAEEWPMCGICGKPMQLFLQLKLDQLPSELENEYGSGLLQLFYCTNPEPLCEVEAGAWSPFSKSTLVRIVQPVSGKALVAIPAEIKDYFPAKLIINWEQREDYPNAEESHDIYNIRLAENDKENWQIWDELGDDWPVDGDKLAGWPYWVQGVEYPDCPVCQKSMRLVFQLSTEDNLPFSFGDVGTGHITQCKDHHEQVAFGWACH